MHHVDLHDDAQRTRAIETLRLAADALERGQGLDFALHVEPHRVEAFVARFVAIRETDARRVHLRVTFVAEPTAPALP